jgi:signal transduction histidine kinase
LLGQPVLTAHAVVDPPGWSVFVEQPLGEALAPLYAAVARTVLLLLAGFGLAVLASLLLARRMVAPIRALEAGAARVGSGALDHSIEVRTGDELETLAEAFNTMSSQLQASYAGLEQKIEARTRDLAQALRELEAANRHKSAFLATMSHELRTPLNAIIGFSDLLLALLGGVEQRRDHQARALAEVLEHGLLIVGERASRHHIQLSLDVDPPIGTIVADERKIKQLVFNLLSNAVKFTPDGGRVAVTARLFGQEVEVLVRDTGVGIAEQEQARIFDSFVQVGQDAERAHEGTGLGLALARAFVELHGGRIWVSSQPGAGSTFGFRLPVQSSEEPIRSPEQPETTPDEHRGAAVVQHVG